MRISVLFRRSGLRRALCALLLAAFLLSGLTAFAAPARAEESPVETLNGETLIVEDDTPEQESNPVPGAGHEKQPEGEKTYVVTFPKSDKYTIIVEGDANAVPHGGSLSFTLTTSAAYSGVKPIVTDGNRALKGRQNGDSYIYTLKNVRSDRCVYVNDTDWKLGGYMVTFPAGKGYTVNGIVGGDQVAENTYIAPYLGVMRFKVDVDRGYDRKNLVVTANGDELYERGGEYILSEIDADIDIAITFERHGDYTVTLPSGKGYSIKDVRGGDKLGDHTYTVKQGRDLSFKVDMRKGHDEAALIVRANGVAISPDRGRYVIKNIREDIAVTIGFEKEEALTVTLKAGKGFSYTDVSGGVRAGDNAYLVPYGKALSFELALDEGYVNPLVKAGGKVIQANSRGVYTLDNVRRDTVVTVSLDIAYEKFSVWNKKTDITVSGSALGTPKLRADMLSSTGADYKRLLEQSEEGDVLGAYTVRLSGADILGKLSISFPVGDAYNGEYVNVLRLGSNGKARVFTAKVRNGYALINTSYTGSFLIAGPVDATLLPPKTGDAPNITAPLVLLALAMTLLYSVTQYKRTKLDASN